MFRDERLFKQELQKRYQLLETKEVIEYFNRQLDVEIDIIDSKTGMESILDITKLSEEEFTNIINTAIKNKNYFGKLIK